MPLPAPLDAAVIICAYTPARWGDLLASVASALREQPSGGVVLVIDHNDALLQRAAEAQLGVTLIASAGPPGLSGARNTGVAATSADIVAFLDDDAQARPGWLAALLAPYRDPDVVATGGRIDPAFDDGRPTWLPPELDWIVGCTYRGMPEAGGDVRNVIGAGMSVRRSAFDVAGPFDTGVGRGRSLPVGGEETAFCIRARRLISGARVVYAPDAVVTHRVPAGRAALRYAFTRAWAEGLTKARVSALEGAGAGLATERAYVASTLPAAVLRGIRETVAQRDPAGLARSAVVVGVLGVTGAGFAWERLRGAARDARRPRPPVPADRPLRILQVTPRYAPFVGGVETHTEEVAKRLAARGHAVTVATTDPTGALPTSEMRDGVEILRVDAHPHGRDWHLAPGLIPIIGQRRWDIVHLQGVHTLVPPLGALAAILAGRRFVLTFHSGGHSSRARTAARPLQWRLIAPLLRRADALVAVSRFEAERFSAALGVPRDRIEVIRNGSGASPGGATPSGDGPTGGTQAQPASADTDTAGPPLDGIPAGAPLVISPGRLERYKGHHRVLAAMPAMRRVRPDLRLHLAGSGAFEPELRRQVAELGLEDAVTIGPVPRDRMPDALARAGVVTLLSEYEAHPVAVMEAVAARRRVVVADTSGFRELAEEGLVRAIPLDAPPEATAAAILAELERTDPLPQRDLPTWDATTDEIEALYRRLVGA